jgi:hypothetical protein
MSRSRTGNKVLIGVRRFNRLKRTHEILISAPPLMAAARRRSFSNYTNDRTEPIHFSEVLHGVPLTIDITQDDETLKLAFRVWLAGTRAIVGQAKRPIGAKEFSEWKEYRILQVFDLEFWGRLNGLRYSDSLLARILWPDAEVDAEERLRKVSRKKMLEIFQDWSFVSRFWQQLELSKFLGKSHTLDSQNFDGSQISGSAEASKQHSSNIWITDTDNASAHFPYPPEDISQRRSKTITLWAPWSSHAAT